MMTDIVRSDGGALSAAGQRVAQAAANLLPSILTIGQRTYVIVQLGYEHGADLQDLLERCNDYALMSFGIDTELQGLNFERVPQGTGGLRQHPSFTQSSPLPFNQRARIVEPHCKASAAALGIVKLWGCCPKGG
jgi:hypothetical protein